MTFMIIIRSQGISISINFDKSLVHFRHVIEAPDDCELDLKIRNKEKNSCVKGKKENFAI